MFQALPLFLHPAFKSGVNLIYLETTRLVLVSVAMLQIAFPLVFEFLKSVYITFSNV